MTSFHRRVNQVRAHLRLGRTRRRTLRRVASAEAASRRAAAVLVLRDLGDALMAHRLRVRAVREYLDETLGPVLRRRKGESVAAKLAADIAEPPGEEQENPLRGAREAAAYFITSPRLRLLQGHIVRAAFANWYGLEVSDAQAAVLGCYSDTAWLARGLMKCAGLPVDERRLGADERKRLEVVLEPYVCGLDLRRRHLEGLTHPGRAILATLSQRRRVGRLKRRGFSPEDIRILYPETLDEETLRIRCEKVETLGDDALRSVRNRETALRFENYLHLQTLVLTAPSRGPKRLGRFMAAVEQRHAA